MPQVYTNRYLRAALAAFVVSANLFLFGCSTVTVQESMLKPAVFNMAGYEQITVGQIDSPYAPYAADPIRQQLITSIQGTGRFRVFDRDSMAEGIREQELAQYTGLFEAGSGAGAGKFQLANALVTGRVDRLNFATGIEQSTQYVNENTTQPIYRVHAKSDISITLKVIDLETLEVAASAPIKAIDQVSNDWTTAYPPPDIDPGPCFDRIYAQVSAQFMSKIAPYQQPVEVKLYSIGPGVMKQEALRCFRGKEYGLACSTFGEIAQHYRDSPKTKPKEMAKALHNLATAEEFSGNYQKAMDLTEESLGYYTSKETLALRSRIRERLADVVAFENQGGMN